MKQRAPTTISLIAWAALGFTTMAATAADAQRSRGGGAARTSGSYGNAQASRPSNAPPVRSQSRSSINSTTNRSSSVNQNTNVNRNTNVNVNRNIDVDVDNHYRGGDDYNPVARAAVATAAIATTAAIVGSYHRSLPPSCVTVVRGSASYYQCGSSWYQPVYSGTTVQYVIVEAP